MFILNPIPQRCCSHRQKNSRSTAVRTEPSIPSRLNRVRPRWIATGKWRVARSFCRRGKCLGRTLWQPWVRQKWCSRLDLKECWDEEARWSNRRDCKDQSCKKINQIVEPFSWSPVEQNDIWHPGDPGINGCVVNPESPPLPGQSWVMPKPSEPKSEKWELVAQMYLNHAILNSYLHVKTPSWSTSIDRTSVLILTSVLSCGLTSGFEAFFSTRTKATGFRLTRPRDWRKRINRNSSGINAPLRYIFGTEIVSAIPICWRRGKLDRVAEFSGTSRMSMHEARYSNKKKVKIKKGTLLPKSLGGENITYDSSSIADQSMFSLAISLGGYGACHCLTLMLSFVILSQVSMLIFLVFALHFLLPG